MKKVYRTLVQAFGCLVFTLVLAPRSFSESPSVSLAIAGYSPDATESFPDSVYWGDTHLHTSLSLDAYVYGNRLGPEKAYRFAKGEVVTTSNGMQARLRRRLDFLVIADHASNLGLMQKLESGSSDLLALALGQRWAATLADINNSTANDPQKAAGLISQLMIDGFTQGQLLSEADQYSVWSKVAALADMHNDPGRFTALIGYEWTQLFYNLHRVIIFKDSADKVGRARPFSQYDSSDPEDLWAYMENYEQQIGGEVLAIPHNGNLSSGMMFAIEDAGGEPLSTDYAKLRSRWEPLYEVTQIKGDSETFPALSTADEFADYERISIKEDLSRGSAWSEGLKKKRNLTHYDSWLTQKIQSGDKLWNYRYGYVRPALKLGLQQQAKIGVNPFKFGLIGSTDSHTSLATADDNNFWGKLAPVEPSSQRMLGAWNGPGGSTDTDLKGYFATAWRMNAAGYTAIWATENTREALFDAMIRKEVYASTGPRINVRFFGGWNYQPDDAFKPDLARIGYDKGVPMGGDLTAAPKDKAPTFLIRAVKDPDGANLDRVQVIKGWRDLNGELHEKIYNVALSGGREDNGVDTQKIGSTVDVPKASYTNTIGDPELTVVWTDPDFDENELAFYYLRVLEIPTPRWTAYDAKIFGLNNIPKDVPMVTQERAYSSPIWYSPSAKKRETVSSIDVGL